MELMSASEAKTLAKKHNDTGLAKIAEIIKDEAAKGKYGCTIGSDRIEGRPSDIVDVLKKKGYTADHVSDQRDGNYYQIEWSK